MKHALTFRGQDYSIPAGYGRCTRCEALLDMETWLSEECRGGDPQLRASATKEEEREAC